VLQTEEAEPRVESPAVEEEKKIIETVVPE